MKNRKIVLYFVRNINGNKKYIDKKIKNQYKKLGYFVEEEWILCP